jgi:hypothetical protein
MRSELEFLRIYSRGVLGTAGEEHPVSIREMLCTPRSRGVDAQREYIYSGYFKRGLIDRSGHG